ncbi:hypothetical protein BAE44_0012138 [Dichanthelium oligosanthes]|uniref:Mitochondrial import inner membrane translocase subunit n=1 Tax=Dichanthelium oligosanthes TaxID=888268 RepID=A0A1E5VNZ5_9POAL|nr:hypothetical protein BAE44_0012138 [Dichanthelium oligosanthes]
MCVLGGAPWQTSCWQTKVKVTDVCWDKCIMGSIQSSFSRSVASCLSNCAESFAEGEVDDHANCCSLH